jgi:uracil-DNA glycosylase family 4
MPFQTVTSLRELKSEIDLAAGAVGLTVECPPDGLFNAQIAIVGEAPGTTEVTNHSPLTGGSGRFLWDVLRRQNLTRNHVYITNAVKRRIVGEDDERNSVPTNELSHWAAILRQELASLPKLKIIVALGNTAMQALANETGITNWRGSVIDTKIGDRDVQVLCTFNPAMILREPRWDMIFRFDLGKIKRMMDGSFRPPDIDTRFNLEYEDALDAIVELHQAGAAGTPIAFDIETIAGETACIGFAADHVRAVCINFRDQRTNRYTLQQEFKIRLHLAAMFADTRIKFIAQNGNFDCYWLWYRDRIRVHAVWFDTMLAHHLLYPPIPHSLGFITSQYTDMPFYKDEGKDWREIGDINQFWRYNGKDCCATRQAAFKMLDELRGRKLDEFFFGHVMRLQPHLVAMTVLGVKVDMGLKEQLYEQIGADVATKRERFVELAREATGDPDLDVNPASPKQLAKLFFADLKLVGRGVKTNKENRDRMRKHPRTSAAARAMLTALDDWSEDNKFFGTYVKMVIDEDGRVRCEYKQTGVQSAPGRLSSASVMWGSGTNLQNQPERAKEMYIADEGYEFSYFDMSQIEARIVAWKAKIKVWIAQFEQARLDGKYDAHRALASEMFKVPYDEVPEKDRDADGKPTIRFIAKRCRHGLNYRMAADRLATVTGLSGLEAEKAYRIYHRTTPEIMVWWEDTEKEVRKNRKLTNAFGREWLLLERIDDDSLNSIIAFYPQSTAGDKVAQVIYQCHEDPEWPRYPDGRLRAHVVLNIHDALIAINLIKDGPIVRKIMKRHAESPIYIDGEPLIVPAEFGVSVPDDKGVRRWSTIKKIK